MGQLKMDRPLLQLLLEIEFTALTCPFWFSPSRAPPLSPWKTVSFGSWGSSVPGWLLQGPRRPSGWKAQRNSKSLSWSRMKEQFQRVNADALLVSVIDVFPVPMQQCVEFFLKSERPAGSSLLFLNPFPRWDEKCNTFQLTLDFLQKYFWKRILHVEHMKTVRGWEGARF